jgi:hypothetical protein
MNATLANKAARTPRVTVFIMYSNRNAHHPAQGAALIGAGPNHHNARTPPSVRSQHHVAALQQQGAVKRPAAAMAG